MPAKSKAQQRFLYSKFGSTWVHSHHFSNSTKGLPNHVDKRRHKTSN